MRCGGGQIIDRHPRGTVPGALGEVDGVVPDGTIVFDADDIPGVANLIQLSSVPAQAATDSCIDGEVEFYVDKWLELYPSTTRIGWRLREGAISTCGSEQEEGASCPMGRPPRTTSPHVSGDATRHRARSMPLRLSGYHNA